MLTPAYFNFVIIDCLEYALLHISLQFADQVKSSLTIIPRILQTLFLSMYVLFTVSLVAKSDFVPVNTIAIRLPESTKRWDPRIQDPKEGFRK